MAKKQTIILPITPLSELAEHMLKSYSLARLPMMKGEYQADLPHDMPAHQRQARAAAIEEIESNPRAVEAYLFNSSYGKKTNKV